MWWSDCGPARRETNYKDYLGHPGEDGLKPGESQRMGDVSEGLFDEIKQRMVTLCTQAMGMEK